MSEEQNQHSHLRSWLICVVTGTPMGWWQVILCTKKWADKFRADSEKVGTKTPSRATVGEIDYTVDAGRFLVVEDCGNDRKKAEAIARATNIDLGFGDDSFVGSGI